MRVLITGMNGFAGQALCELLLHETHWTLIGVSNRTSGERVSPRVQWWQLDLRDPDGIRRLIKFERPDLIFHLAAQALVPRSWEDPWGTFETNVRGTLNLFDAVVNAGLTPRIVVVGSNEVYGAPSSAADLPFSEQSQLRPNNPYGVSKVAQEMLALQYRHSRGLDVVAVRPFNHVGPGQSPSFVISGFARQIAEIESGRQEPVMDVGNMNAQRDYTDVRDITRGYYLLARLADAGKIYNICAGVPRSIQSILDLMLTMTDIRITIRSDPSKFRIVDTPISFGDNTQIKRDLGWQPLISVEKTIGDTLTYWRQRTSAQDAAVNTHTAQNAGNTQS